MNQKTRKDNSKDVNAFLKEKHGSVSDHTPTVGRTPTPWEMKSSLNIGAVNSDENLLSVIPHKGSIHQENAKFIVRAVNSHEGFIQTLKHIQDLAEENTKSVQDGYCQIAEWARNQIAKAEGSTNDVSGGK